ncbi:hypothetical protein VTO73DRAFT_13263 [Trametes versicolor]
MHQSAEISVILSTPSAKTLCHWAIYLRITDGSEIQHLLYQAAGNAEEQFVLDIQHEDPKALDTFERQIDVCIIDGAADVTEAREVVEGQPMQNGISTWNCQDWVVDTLEALHDARLVDDYEYGAAMTTLEDLYFK